jgi:hypothetical protein
MKIKYENKYAGGRKETMDLETWLSPVNTGSQQGTVEQVQAELEVCKRALAGILATLVNKGLLDIKKAEDLAGMHDWFIQYRYGSVEYIED